MVRAKSTLTFVARWSRSSLPDITREADWSFLITVPSERSVFNVFIVWSFDRPKFRCNLVGVVAERTSMAIDRREALYFCHLPMTLPVQGRTLEPRSLAQLSRITCKATSTRFCRSSERQPFVDVYAVTRRLMWNGLFVNSFDRASRGKKNLDLSLIKRDGHEVRACLAYLRCILDDQWTPAKIAFVFV